MMCEQAMPKWPEPVVRVQSLSQSGITTVPERYIKPPQHRPGGVLEGHQLDTAAEIPVIDLSRLADDDQQEETVGRIGRACREWGFFQVVNHGVSHELMGRVRDMWGDFFGQPMEVKQQYSNEPSTYEGYGSRLGVEKNAILDWNDYYFLNYMPPSLRNPNKWPAHTPSSRGLIEEYGGEMMKLCGKLMKVFAEDLGLEDQNSLINAFGGEEGGIGGSLRVNYYPKCPQPHLTLGLSPHSDPGGITILLPDHDVPGLQVRHAHTWLTVKTLPNAFTVNIGDQIQILSNAIYKSVEHRVMVNSVKDRVSLAFFYNPKGDLLIQPAKELVSEEFPALYKPTKYQEYRLLIRKKGPCGKTQIDSLISTT